MIAIERDIDFYTSITQKIGLLLVDVFQIGIAITGHGYWQARMGQQKNIDYGFCRDTITSRLSPSKIESLL
jgi:hypothetical protein